MPKLKTTKWESGNNTKLVPWEEDVILTAEQTQILLELQEFARKPNNVGEQYQYVIVPTAIFDKLTRLYNELSRSRYLRTK